MSKFKVGDRVIVKEECLGNPGKVMKKRYGDKSFYTVTSTEEVYVRFGYDESGYHEKCFELFVEKVFLDEDLFTL